MLDTFQSFLNVSSSSALRKKMLLMHFLRFNPPGITHNYKMHLNNCFLHVSVCGRKYIEDVTKKVNLQIAALSHGLQIGQQHSLLKIINSFLII